MKLIIDIDKEVLNKLPEAELGSNVIEDVLEAVENGTPLNDIKEIYVGMNGNAVQIYPNNDVLDKISAEIEEVQTYDGIYIDRVYVLQIIDKYRNEVMK